MLNPVQALKSAWQHKFDFRGRARRSEYWWTVLASSVLLAATAFLDMSILPDGVTGQLEENYAAYGWAGFLNDLNAFPLSNIIYIALLPILTFQAMRRLHDTGRQGWLAVMVTVLSMIVSYVSPVILQTLYFSLILGNELPSSFTGLDWFNFIFWTVYFGLCLWQLVLNVLPSQHGENRYGSNPHGHGNIDVFV